jgi:hypothetical protein
MDVVELTYEQRNRIECVNAAWLILNSRGGEIDMTDLHSLAYYIETGKDPYATSTDVPDEPTLFTD